MCWHEEDHVAGDAVDKFNVPDTHWHSADLKRSKPCGKTVRNKIYLSQVIDLTIPYPWLLHASLRLRPNRWVVFAISHTDFVMYRWLLASWLAFYLFADVFRPPIRSMMVDWIVQKFNEAFRLIRCRLRWKHARCRTLFPIRILPPPPSPPSVFVLCLCASISSSHNFIDGNAMNFFFCCRWLRPSSCIRITFEKTFNVDRRVFCRRWSMVPTVIIVIVIVNENKQPRRAKTLVTNSPIRIRFCLSRSFFPISSFLTIDESAAFFFLKRWTTTHTSTHTHMRVHICRKLDVKFYCRDALLFDQFHHFRCTERPSLEPVGIHSALGCAHIWLCMRIYMRRKIQSNKVLDEQRGENARREHLSMR